MGRTAEEPIKLPPTLLKILKDVVAKVGGQVRAGEIAGVNQSTIGRYLKEKARPTYTTLMKLSRTLPGMPTPVIVTRDREHAQWCELGARLHEKAPDEFRKLLQNAANKARLAEISDGEWSGDPPPEPSPIAVAALKSVIANPLRTDRKRSIRRG